MKSSYELVFVNIKQQKDYLNIHLITFQKIKSFVKVLSLHLIITIFENKSVLNHKLNSER